MLVHMAPQEVAGLQALAMKHGGSLTINPDTGLPEAGALSKLLPTLIGIALAPATGGASLGITEAWQTAALVGGVQTLATGSLKKGLMAGLGAYGGAGLAESFAGLGAGELAQGQISANMPALAEGASQAQIADYTQQVNDLRTAGLQNANQLPIADKLAAGAKSAMENPLAFAKNNWAPVAAASLPVLQAITTTTPGQSAAPFSPGRIREKRWDGRQFVDVANTDANVFNTSNRSFSDPYRGYNDGGGIVALAGGGMPHYDGSAGSVVGAPTALTDEQLFQKTGSWEAAAAARDAQNNALNQYNWQQQAATANAANAAKLNTTAANYVQTAAVPTETTADFISGANTAGIGLTQPLATALQNSGLSAAAQYALTHANIGPDVNAEETYGGLKGLSSNINYIRSGLQDQIGKGKLTGQNAREQALTEMNKYGLNEADIMRATGKTLKELFPDTAVKPPVVVNPPTYDDHSGYHWDGTNWVKNVDATQVTTTGVTTPTDLYTAPASSLPVGVSGNTGPSQIGGGATVNPNGTITTSPRIPGIDVGGFKGSTGMRDAYTKGGGSLGYTSPTFKTIEDFNAKYVDKRLTGDSKAAYDYLTGKAGAAYPTKSSFNGQLSQDYATAVLGYPARGNLPYIYNKDTGRMDVNPDYVAPGRDAAGNVTYSMSTNDVKKSLTDTPLSGQALYDWAIANNLSAQQIADATGRNLSSVYADFRAGSKSKTEADKKKADDAAAAGNTSSESSSGTGGEAAGGLQQAYAMGGMPYSGGGLGTLGGYSDGGRLLKGPGDGVSDSIPATIGRKQQPARLADGEFVVPARIVSELGNGSTDAGAKKLYAMMDRVQRARGKTTGKNKVAANSRSDKYLPA